MKEVPRQKLPWKDCKFGQGAILVPVRKTEEAVLVGDTIVCIIPPWPQMTHKAKEQLLKAFGGELVYVEVILSYQFTYKYYNPKDVGK